jgi:cation:H+ antiporter
MTLVLFVVGLVLLVLGAELLVRGASRLAATIGLSPLVIGLTVVAFGTSSPELAVSVLASLRGDSDISLGNVVGSNIFNVLLILGLAATLRPLAVSAEVVREQTPVMIAVSVFALLLALNGTIGRGEGALLFAGVWLYTGVLVVRGRRRSRAEASAVSAAGGAPPPPPPTGASIALDVGLAAVGLVLLIVGSSWLVDAARAAALALGVPEITVGLTIVAAGTSLPELATSLLATYRGERDLAVGNIVGSNIFNLLAILGFAAMVSPDGVQAAARAVTVDLPVMVAAALVCYPMFATGHRVARGEGLLLLAGYLVYTALLVRSATG